MKSFRTCVLLVFLFAGLLLAADIASAQTTVWLVRHAEKDTSAAGQPLTQAGRQRADILVKKLENANIAAVWTTDFKRTRQTAAPTAAHFNLIPRIYSDFHAVADTIIKYYKNKSVLIVGHTNTVMPTIVALGAAKPLDILAEEDYDMLFKVTIHKDGHATVEAGYYGNSHHVTQIPKKYLKGN